jgi:protoporphyrinogen oxidase
MISTINKGKPGRSTESSDHAGGSVVLGAGPAGLAAAFQLAKAGKKPVILEKSANAGGLMRAIKRGPFEVDFGRKEIYERIPEVVELWEQLLGSDFVPYPHRIGLLYQGTVIERSRKFRGIFRGLPPRLICSTVIDFVSAQAGSIWAPAPRNYEERWHRAWGGKLTRILSQGYSEKFYGVDWRDRPPDSDLRKLDGEPGRSGLWQRIREKSCQAEPERPYQWRHPRRGTGQLVDALVAGIIDNGGSFVFGAEVKGFDTSGNEIERVHFSTDSGARSLAVEHVVSAIPMSAVSSLLGLTTEELDREDRDRGRQTILLYLFLDEPANFPHACLYVSCPDLVAGRVTNYANFGGDMVPDGKGCIAIEVFTRVNDPILDLNDSDLTQRLIDEVAGARLLDRRAIADQLFIRLPGAEASNEFQTFRTPAMIELRENIRKIENLYECNRAGVDISVFAGLKAARAIIDSNRESFDVEAAPEVVPYSNSEVLPAPALRS